MEKIKEQLFCVHIPDPLKDHLYLEWSITHLLGQFKECIHLSVLNITPWTASESVHTGDRCSSLERLYSPDCGTQKPTESITCTAVVRMSWETSSTIQVVVFLWNSNGGWWLLQADTDIISKWSTCSLLILKPSLKEAYKLYIMLLCWQRWFPWCNSHKRWQTLPPIPKSDV